MILSLASVHGPAIWFAILTNDLRQSGPTDRNLSLSHVELYPKSMPPCCFQRKIAKCGLTTFLCNMIQHSLILSLSLFALELMLDFYRFFLHHDRKQASYTKCFPDWKIMSQHEFLPKILLVQFASTCRHTSIPQNEGHNPVLFNLFRNFHLDDLTSKNLPQNRPKIHVFLVARHLHIGRLYSAN